MADQEDLISKFSSLSRLCQGVHVFDGQGHQKTHHDDIDHDHEGEDEGVSQEGELVELSGAGDQGALDPLLLGVLQVVILQLPRHHHKHLKIKF